jgi:hypothetical protein
MKKSEVQQSAQGAAHTHTHTGAEPHVCTAACTHAGAAYDGTIAAATGKENVIMGSPERGLGGRPAPKDAVHKDT